jgi:hydroxypyruvate isomerase
MFQLAVCAEMVFRDLPIAQRVRKIAELGFHVEIWDWTRHDLAELQQTGATFSSMTGYIEGDLITESGARRLIETAGQSIEAARRLRCPRLNLHGTGLDSNGMPVRLNIPRQSEQGFHGKKNTNSTAK